LFKLIKSFSIFWILPAKTSTTFDTLSSIFLALVCSDGLFSSSTGEQELYDDDNDATMLHASLSVNIDRVYVALP